VDAAMSYFWFDLLTPETLCRVGGNGPKHPSQLYAIKKYVRNGDTFLDIGCGSGATYEAILKDTRLQIKYKGVDFIQKNIDYCKRLFPGMAFEKQFATFLKEPTESYDVVFSRHLLEHLPSFESGLQEHLRVSKNLVIIILWAPLLNGDQDQIKNIEYEGKIYPNEYSNRYAEAKIRKTLAALKDWDLVEFTKEVGSGNRSHDTVIVLQRREPLK
jgi:SAM-dependent methyltransferase